MVLKEIGKNPHMILEEILIKNIPLYGSDSFRIDLFKKSTIKLKIHVLEEVCLENPSL